MPGCDSRSAALTSSVMLEQPAGAVGGDGDDRGVGDFVAVVEVNGCEGSGVNRPLVPVAVLVFRRTGSRQSWVVSTFRSRSRSRSRAVLE